jgi:hypothetical protein
MMPGIMMEISMNRINPLKLKSLEVAKRLLRDGRPVKFVKSVTGITIVEMVRQGWLFEIKIPHPKGYTVDLTTGEQNHDGSVMSTGQFRSIFARPVRTSGLSNKQMKRENRKAFFDSRRQRKAA